ncbi:MAG: MarR family winged helix-turn-helix transcriptional regulator, partial [Anaerolineae bacterium]|nr:MarR family winged helix-turn-helix transcriptional regulator [Anaerolineae bacterium]
MENSDLSERIEAVRHFNRFYTRQIGLLSDHYLNSPFSLTEARVIFELAQQGATHATELNKHLGLDAGYLSRILRNFEKQALINKHPSETDGRQSIISLTQKGREVFAGLNNSSSAGICRMLGKVSEDEQERVVASMNCIQSLLDEEKTEPKVPYILRPPRPGDMGWLVQQHARLYAEEYGWNEQFEALVAEIAAAFIRNYDPKFE